MSPMFGRQNPIEPPVPGAVPHIVGLRREILRHQPEHVESPIPNDNDD